MRCRKNGVTPHKESKERLRCGHYIDFFPFTHAKNPTVSRFLLHILSFRKDSILLFPSDTNFLPQKNARPFLFSQKKDVRFRFTENKKLVMKFCLAYPKHPIDQPLPSKRSSKYHIASLNSTLQSRCVRLQAMALLQPQ